VDNEQTIARVKATTGASQIHRMLWLRWSSSR